MHKPLFIMILSLAAFCGRAGADVLAVPEAQPQPVVPASLPAKGDRMAGVLKQFGEPTLKHKPAGGDSRLHPPITRWDYAGFSVFFERGTVIDAVVEDQPAEVHHTDELKPAAEELKPAP